MQLRSLGFELGCLLVRLLRARCVLVVGGAAIDPRRSRQLAVLPVAVREGKLGVELRLETLAVVKASQAS